METETKNINQYDLLKEDVGDSKETNKKRIGIPIRDIPIRDIPIRDMGKRVIGVTAGAAIPSLLFNSGGIKSAVLGGLLGYAASNFFKGKKNNSQDYSKYGSVGDLIRHYYLRASGIPFSDSATLYAKDSAQQGSKDAAYNSLEAYNKYKDPIWLQQSKISMNNYMKGLADYNKTRDEIYDRAKQNWKKRFSFFPHKEPSDEPQYFIDDSANYSAQDFNIFKDAYLKSGGSFFLNDFKRELLEPQKKILRNKIEKNLERPIVEKYSNFKRKLFGEDEPKQTKIYLLEDKYKY